MIAPIVLSEFQKQMIKFIKRPFLQKKGSKKKSNIRFIKSSKNLSAYERITIYQELYWEKGIEFLKGYFPLVEHFLGQRKFNRKIALPFLRKFPFIELSTKNALSSFPKWLAKEYCGKDYHQITLLARIDGIFGRCFLDKKLKPFDPSLEQDFSSTPILLQPHVHLAHFDYNLLSIIQKLPKEKKFSLCQSSTFHIIFRNRLGLVSCKIIDERQFFFLKSFQNSRSLKEAVAFLENAYPNEKDLDPYAWFDFWNQKEIFISGKVL